MREAEVDGAVNLVLARGPHQLIRRLGQREQAVHARMHARETAAVGVDRQVAARRDPPARHEAPALALGAEAEIRSEEHTSELQPLMSISYAVFCLKKKKRQQTNTY